MIGKLKSRKWWIQGGGGVAFEAPAFWTVDNPKELDFNVGFPSLVVSTGYELLQKKSFTIDVQYHIYAGQVNLDGDIQERKF